MGPYCYAVAAGEYVFLGGTPGTTHDALVEDGIPKGRMAGQTTGRADMAAQTLQALESIRHAGKLAGAKWSNALRFNLFLDNWKEIDLFIKTYRLAIGAASPAETLTGYGLYQPSMIMEIDGLMSTEESKPVSGPGYGRHPYLPAHAGKRSGDLLCLSAILPIDEVGKIIGVGSAEAQVRQCLLNLERIMHGVGSSLLDIVRLRVFVADSRDHETVQAEIESVFKDRHPLITIVGASNPFVDARVMIEPTAYLGAKKYFEGPEQARAVRIGDLVLTNGILPVRNNAVVNPDNTSRQTRMVLERLSELLNISGSSIADVCQTQVGLADFRTYDDCNSLYANFFQYPYVARQTVQFVLGNRFQQGMRYQIEATAVVGAAERAEVVTATDNFYHRRVAMRRRA